VKAVILGAGGQLAYDLQRAVAGWDLVPLKHADLDVCDYPRVRDALAEAKADVVINTAAFHRVDDCEDQWEKAFQVNTFAVRNLAQVCADLDGTLVHMSTDYVFGGEKHSPYTEDDAPNPLNVYGVSKLAGEYFVRDLCRKHFVIRSSGLYGVAGSSGKGGNFVETMIRMAKEGKPIRVVDDQVLAPTYTRDLAEKIVDLLGTQAYGLYHITNGGECSWYRFAAEIFSVMGADPDLTPISSEVYAARALRPSYSVLGHGRMVSVGIKRPADWTDALASYMQDAGHI
jgi:dTDP-4-dehydrorhamnose reductase